MSIDDDIKYPTHAAASAQIGEFRLRRNFTNSDLAQAVLRAVMDQGLGSERLVLYSSVQLPEAVNRLELKIAELEAKLAKVIEQKDEERDKLLSSREEWLTRLIAHLLEAMDGKMDTEDVIRDIVTYEMRDVTPDDQSDEEARRLTRTTRNYRS